MDTNDNLVFDIDAQERLVRFCAMTDAMLENMSPAQRDRMMQIHLAAARGPVNNLLLLCDMTDMLCEIIKHTQSQSTKRNNHAGK